MSTAIGLDFGTSGARAIAIDGAGQAIATSARPYDIADPQSWQAALYGLLSDIPLPLRQTADSIAVAATSGTVLLCDRNGQPLSPVLPYDDRQGAAAIAQWGAAIPSEHIARSATSSVAKALWLRDRLSNEAAVAPFAWLQHQADRIAYLLHGKLGITDYHNALKLGGDPETLTYPGWVPCLLPEIHLPAIAIPGRPVAAIDPAIARALQLAPTCQVCAGTTDSIAAFLACLGDCLPQPGDAVTSLGSTLALKLLSRQRVDAPAYGAYSHRLDVAGQTLWLVGGASNAGGRVLRHFFRDCDLATLSACIDPRQPSPYDYYPLLAPGERFPHNDPAWPPRLTPRPDDAVAFLHGLLEGLARIEAEGYALLHALGAPAVARLWTAGGGARNPAWAAIRARHLGIAPAIAAHTEAAYGAALMARGKTA